MSFNKILFLALILSIVCCGGNDESIDISCLPSDLQNGVIAFYSFNDSSLNDESSNGNNLTNTTTATSTTDRIGNTNCAFQFDNSLNDEFLTSANTTFLDNLNTFSISLWYQPLVEANSNRRLEVLLGRGDQSRCPDRTGEWSLGLFDCRRAVFGHNNSVWADEITDSPFDCEGEATALSDKWHHVVATKRNDEYTIYFNGNLETSATGNAACYDLHIAENIGDLFIGNNFIGKIDDIIIYDRAISTAEVSTLFGLEPCCF